MSEPIDKVHEEVLAATEVLKKILRPGTRWKCSMGCSHLAPEYMYSRELIEQGKIQSDEYRSGAVWSLAIHRLIDENVITNPYAAPDFRFKAR